MKKLLIVLIALAVVAPVAAQEEPPVVLEDCEEPFDGIAGAIRGGVKDHGLEDLGHVVHHRQQQILLGREEVVEGAAGRLCLLNDLVNSGLRIALSPKELGGSVDEPFAGSGFPWSQTIS